MIQVRVSSLAVDSSGQPVLILEPVADDPARRVLPIWVGSQEAASIMVVLEGEETPRPLTHDLLASALERLGALVERVDVVRLVEGTFYAEISLRTPSGLQVLDARPSDSIALALRTRSPIWVADDVFDSASITPREQDEPAPDVDTETQVAAFTDFLDQVEPDDFRG